MFTHDFNFSITEQYFNPDLFLFFDAKEINQVQQKRIKIQYLLRLIKVNINSYIYNFISIKFN